MEILSKTWFGAAAVLAVMTASSLAQTPTLSMPAGAPERRVSQEELERRRAVDDAYKDAIKKIPDKKETAADPWATVRPQSSSSSAPPKASR